MLVLCLLPLVAALATSASAAALQAPLLPATFSIGLPRSCVARCPLTIVGLVENITEIGSGVYSSNAGRAYFNYNTNQMRVDFAGNGLVVSQWVDGAANKTYNVSAPPL